MTIRICGELDALDPIFLVSMVCERMIDTTRISLIRARRFPTRSCLDTSWMFNGSSAKPSQDALDLVAYLRSLGRERDLAGDTGSEQVDRGMAMEMSSSYSARGIPDTVPRIDLGGINPNAPVFTTTGNFEVVNQERGRRVFQHNCSGCHGVNADGNGIARPGLLPVLQICTRIITPTLI
jgi:mono/diheme cytochrome c family protein